MFDSSEERDETPRIKQLSVFLPNRVGALLSVTRSLDAFAIKIHALSILDAADHAVVRLIVDRPALAAEALTTDGYSVFESDLVAVALEEGDSDAIRRVLSALLLAELNVHYVYSLIPSSAHRPILALHVEDHDAAAFILGEKNLDLVGQDELE